jgi:putative PIN family toxin of toxin-antitoxin system
VLKVVVDTNQLVSSLLSTHGIQGRIVDEWRRRAFQLFAVPGQVDEVAEVLSRPKIATKYSVAASDRQALPALIHTEAVVLPDAPAPRVCRDLDDDYLLGCAAAQQLDYIVTGESALIDVGQYQGVAIVNGRQFLDILSRYSE